jgi:predicted transcriptional regulator
MLKKILLFVDEGFCSEEELALELGMEREELEREVEELCRLGYLRVEQDGDAKKAKMCRAGLNLRDDAGVGRRLALTEKGKKVIY